MGGKCWTIRTSNVKANKKWAASKNQREMRLKRWDLFRLQRTSISNAVLQGRGGMAQECVLIPLLSWWKQVSIWIHATTPDTLMLQGCWKPQTEPSLKDYGAHDTEASPMLWWAQPKRRSMNMHEHSCLSKMCSVCAHYLFCWSTFS